MNLSNLYRHDDKLLIIDITSTKEWVKDYSFFFHFKWKKSQWSACVIFFWVIFFGENRFFVSFQIWWMINIIDIPLFALFWVRIQVYLYLGPSKIYSFHIIHLDLSIRRCSKAACESGLKYFLHIQYYYHYLIQNSYKWFYILIFFSFIMTETNNLIKKYCCGHYYYNYYLGDTSTGPDTLCLQRKDETSVASINQWATRCDSKNMGAS